MPAAVIRERLSVYPVLGKPVHLPRLAEETAGPAIFWTLTLVMRHWLRPHAYLLRVGADALGHYSSNQSTLFLTSSAV